MSTNSSKLDTKKGKGMIKIVQQLEDEVAKLKAEDKYKDYCINS